MNRLTNKETNYIDLYVRMARENWKERGRIEYAWADKLQKFEDIEEELGCPLEVVFKALKEGIYTKNIDNTLTFYKGVSLKHNDNQFIFILKHRYYVVIKNYKKTWWLKEDKTE